MRPLSTRTYIRPVHPLGDGASAVLSSLTHLLDGSHRAPPDRLGDVIARVGEPFGWDVDAYLVTFDQTRLEPLTAGATAFEVDTDDDGARAFRLMAPVVGTDGRRWVPILDGAERLGVLCATPRPGGLDPTHCAENLRLIAMLVGHLVAAVDERGDIITRIRQTSARTVEAELLWNLLPPLTYASEDVVVAGLLEPCEDVAGDAFDYAANATTLDLVLLDGAGHDLDAGLLTSIALATYRSHRRRGADLAECADAINEVLLRQTDGEGYATGVLARLDTATGVLDYVNAGHPQPLLLRDSRVVTTLDHSGRPIFGLGKAAATVGRVQLEPGDHVVMYTDGITEARDDAGGFFGLDRFISLLEEQAAQDVPTPETLRLVVREVLAHQRQVLQDDATLLVVQWAPGAGLQLLPV